MCYFLWNNGFRILKNSAPIGLLFIVGFSYRYIQNSEYKGICEASTLNLVPKTYRQCNDDTLARSKFKEQSPKFQNILNKKDKQIQFAIEDKDEEKYLKL